MSGVFRRFEAPDLEAQDFPLKSLIQARRLVGRLRNDLYGVEAGPADGLQIILLGHGPGQAVGPGGGALSDVRGEARWSPNQR
jgi:hypothetical protein